MATTKATTSGPVHECYYQCNSRKHASALTAAVTKVNLSDEKVAAYLKWCCIKYSQAVDSEGRTLLHMAASTGRLELLVFLLKHQNIKVNCKDLESFYTPLHRSLYYGQLHCAIKLIQAGANIAEFDAENLTPLDHVMKDRPLTFTYDTKQPCEVYVWGNNTSYNLGIGHNGSRIHPELLAYFRKENISIKQAFMSKFHSLFLGSNGRVWVSGLGSGSRLGLGDESTILVPKVLKVGNTSSVSCKSASVAITHTLLLLENGSVWSFGTNTYHQLGHTPPPEEVPCPKLIKSLKGVTIVGISTSKFHSAFWTKNQLYTCGWHRGQLGHLKSSEDTISAPKLVTSLQLKFSTIEHVATCEGATVLVSSKYQIYLFKDYQCSRLKTGKNFFPIKKICILGGHMDHKVPSSSLQEKDDDDLKILILTTNNCIYLWQETNQHITLCLLSLQRYIDITEMVLNKTCLLITTKDGEAFTGEIKIKNKKIPPENEKSLSPKTNDKFLNTDDYHYIKLRRIPNVHRAVSITSDLKGRNFAVVQTHPKCGLLVPFVESTEMKENMKTFLDTASEYDGVHDVLFEVGKMRYPAHRYIISYSSIVLKEMIDNGDMFDGVTTVRIENIQPQIFQRVLTYIYTGECDLLETGECPFILDPVTEVVQEPPQSPDERTISPDQISAFEYHKQQRFTKRKSSSKIKAKVNDPIEALKEASKILGLTELVKHLDPLVYRDGCIHLVRPRTMKVSPPKFNRKELQSLWDVTLKANDGSVINAHKCILVSRLEYFNCMINHGWLESSLKAPLKLTIPSNVLEVLICYLYTDEAPQLQDSTDMELCSQVLVIADEFLCERLKEFAEVSLSNMITLKIAAEMLQLAVLYNANQLKKCAMEFICLNLSALLESRSLEILDDSLLIELRDFYRSWLPCMEHRNMSSNSNDPSDDLVDKIYETEPVSLEKVEEPTEVKGVPKTKERSQRKKKNSESERIRNISTGSMTSDEELLNSATKKMSDSLDSEDTWIKVTNHSSKVQSKTASKTKATSPEILTTKSPPAIPTPESPQVRVIRPPSLDKKDSFSDSDGDFVLLNSSSNKEFPALGALTSDRTNFTISKGPAEGYKKFVKLSQKQRKKLATKPANQDEVPQKSPEVKSVWGIVEKVDTHSMTAIMKNETANLKPSSDVSALPWQVRLSPTSSLSAIMAAERQQRDVLARMKSKPLEYTQMEDRAIHDLMRLYDISNVTDERITIRRADAVPVAPPVWVSNNR